MEGPHGAQGVHGQQGEDGRMGPAGYPGPPGPPGPKGQNAPFHPNDQGSANQRTPIPTIVSDQVPSFNYDYKYILQRYGVSSKNIVAFQKYCRRQAKNAYLNKCFLACR